MAIIKEKKFKISSVIENLTPSGLSDGEPEKTVAEPCGFFKTSEGELVISYAEQSEYGRTVTDITVTDTAVEVKRRGAVDSDMRFEEGVCHRSLYTVSPYSFDAEVKTKKIRNNMTRDGGSVDIFYDMRIGGADKSVRMKIEIV